MPIDGKFLAYLLLVVYMYRGSRDVGRHPDIFLRVFREAHLPTWIWALSVVRRILRGLTHTLAMCLGHNTETCEMNRILGPRACLMQVVRRIYLCSPGSARSSTSANLDPIVCRLFRGRGLLLATAYLKACLSCGFPIRKPLTSCPTIISAASTKSMSSSGSFTVFATSKIE